MAEFRPAAFPPPEPKVFQIERFQVFYFISVAVERRAGKQVFLPGPDVEKFLVDFAVLFPGLASENDAVRVESLDRDPRGEEADSEMENDPDDDVKKDRLTV